MGRKCWAAVRCLELQHINYCTRDVDASIEPFQRLFGAQFVLDVRAPWWRDVLLRFGGVLFEMFVPKRWLRNARYGANWVGIDSQIGDVAEIRRNLQRRGLGLVFDIGDDWGGRW